MNLFLKSIIIAIYFLSFQSTTNFLDDSTQLLSSITQINFTGQIINPIQILNPLTTFPLLIDPSSSKTIATATRYGQGKVVSFGHTLLTDPGFCIFFANALQWLGNYKATLSILNFQNLIYSNVITCLEGISSSTFIFTASDDLNSTTMTLYDVIAIEYIGNDPPFSNSDIQNIQTYIHQGGSFYVNGQTWTWRSYGRGVNSSLTVYNDYFPNILLVKLGVSFPYDWCFPTILTINPPDSTTSVCLASNNTCCAPTCGTNLYVYAGTTIVSTCPIGLYGDNETNLCAPTCSDGYWGNSTTNQCDLCDSSCSTCTGPTNAECLSCLTRYYAVSQSCNLCDPTCLTCDGPYNSDCLSCLPFLVLTSMRCLCSSGMYYNSNPWPDICSNCSDPCVTCFGPSSSNCSSCPNGLVLSNSQCLQACPYSTYFDNDALMCITCDDNCSTCFGQNPNQCLICKNYSLFLVQGTCVDECLTGSYMAFDKNNYKTCLSAQLINVTSTKLYENHLYSLQFLKKWDQLLINFPNYINISISGMIEHDYSYDILNLTNETYYGFQFYITYTIESIPNNSVLTLLLNVTESNSNNMYILSETEFSFALSSFCPTSSIITNNQCINPQDISIDLSYTSQPDIILISIQGVSSLTFNQINESVSVAIQDFTYQKDYFFLFNTSESECDTCYDLHLLYMKPLYGKKKLSFSLNFPFQTILEFNLPPLPVIATIQLFDYYTNDPSEQALITKITGDQNTIDIATSSSVFVFSILEQSNLPSSVRNLMIVEIMSLIKFIDLNYPQNLQSYFIDGVKLETTLIYNYKFKKDPNDVNQIPKLFQFYELSPYFLDNAGELYSRFLIFWMTGIFILLLTKIFKNKKGKINKILQLIKFWLVWYYVIIVFLTNYQMIIFKALFSFIYPAYLTPTGQLNTAMAIIAFLLYISIGIYFVYVVKNKKNKITPMEFSQRSNASIFPYPNCNKKESTKTLNNIITEELKVSEIYEDNSIGEKVVKEPMRIQEKTVDSFQRFSKKELVQYEKKMETNYPNFQKYQKNALNQWNDNQKADSFQRFSEKELVLNEEKMETNLSNFQKYQENIQRQDETKINSIIPKNEKPTLTKINQNNVSNYEVMGLDQTKSIVLTPNKETKFETIFDSSPLKCDRKSIFSSPIKNKNKNSEVQNTDEDSFLFLYQDLKEEKLLQRHFLIVDLCRQSFIAIIVCTNRLNSFTQILIINLIQCSYLLFAFRTSPFKFGFSVLNFIVCELILTSILLEFLLIGIYDLQNLERIDDRIKIGWAIIYTNFIFKVLVFALLIGKQIADVCEYCRDKKRKRTTVSNCGSN